LDINLIFLGGLGIVNGVKKKVVSGWIIICLDFFFKKKKYSFQKKITLDFFSLARFYPQPILPMLETFHIFCPVKIKRVLGSMVVVDFQIIFCTEMHANDIFFIF